MNVVISTSNLAQMTVGYPPEECRTCAVIKTALIKYLK